MYGDPDLIEHQHGELVWWACDGDVGPSHPYEQSKDNTISAPTPHTMAGTIFIATMAQESPSFENLTRP